MRCTCSRCSSRSSAPAQALAQAYKQAVQFTGKVVALVGVTLAAGVITWAFSPIKFQADMGILLTFMFVWNMLGALILIPALSHFLLPTSVHRGAVAAGPWHDNAGLPGRSFRVAARSRNQQPRDTTAPAAADHCRNSPAHWNQRWLVGDLAPKRAFVRVRVRGWLHRHVADPSG